ncbi:hypothetical protein V6N13_110540 [Hibiscus sabdariffa]
MEFWGAEVKGGQIFKVELENDNRRILHLSQVALGEVTGDNKKEKGNETIYIYLKFKNDNFVIGTLSQEKFPQLPLDLVLNDTFELSHTWKNGSIHITGYHVALGEVTGDNKKEKGNETIYIYLKFKNDNFVIGTLSQEKFPQLPLDLVLNDTFELSHTWKNGSIHITGYHVDTSQGGDVESEEELPQPTINLTKPHATASDPAASQHVKIVEPIKDEGSSDDEDEDDTSEDEDSSEDQEPAMPINGEKESKNDTDSDEDDSEEESSDEDQETPEKAGPSKKRSAESARKTPAPEKKAKLVTPQRTDSKKVGGHTATPHPSKQAKKASAAAKAKQTPKSGGSSFPCKSCGRSFGSENALQSHSKAKHGGLGSMDTEASSVGSFSGSGKDGSDYDKTDMEIHNQVHPIRADWKTGDRKSYASMVAGMQVTAFRPGDVGPWVLRGDTNVRASQVI